MVNINPNQAMFRAAYMNDLYANQGNRNSANPSTNSSANPSTNPRADLPLSDFADRVGQGRDDRDIAIISEEARRLQRSTRAMGPVESSVSQQREMLIPGQGQTELQPQAGLEPPRDISSASPDQGQPEREMEIEPGLDRLDQLDRPGQQGPAATSPEAPAAQQTAARAAESDNFQQQLQDLTRSTAANINSVNSSSIVQAYASAANVTQATMIVNYKV